MLSGMYEIRTKVLNSNDYDLIRRIKLNKRMLQDN